MKIKKTILLCFLSIFLLTGCAESDNHILNQDNSLNQEQTKVATDNQTEEKTSLEDNKEVKQEENIINTNSTNTEKVNPENSGTLDQQQNTTVENADLSNNNYYTNTDGNSVHSPAYSETVPSGVTAKCKDGTYSFSQHRQGTCSHHGGVLEWL